MSDLSAMMLCRACGRDAVFRLFAAREMLFGLRHRFEYGECPHCGSLQIRQIPANLSDYYPADYYSLQPPPARTKRPRPGGRVIASWLLRSQSWPAAWLAWRLRWKYPFFHWCRLSLSRARRFGLSVLLLYSWYLLTCFAGRQSVAARFFVSSFPLTL